MNKILLVAVSAIILGSMTTIQTADAQEVLLCIDGEFPCCPPAMQPLCGLMVEQDRFKQECTICNTAFEKVLYQGTIWQFETITKLTELVQVQGTQIVNLQKDIDSMKGVIITEGRVDQYAGGIIVDGLIVGMLGIAIVVGIANYRRQR